MAEHINFFPGPGGKPQLTTNSHMLVGLLARVLKNHPEVVKVRIDVHGKDVSKEVTQERGEVVLNALVRNGVDGQRLKVAGLGLGPNRVEFIVEGRAKPRRYLAPFPGVAPTEKAVAPAAAPTDEPQVPARAPTAPPSPAPAPTEEVR
jgi:hypothetical protein